MKQINLRISPDLHRRIVARAAREGMSMNAWLNHLAETTVDADIAQDRQARAGAKAAALGLLHPYDAPPPVDDETYRQGLQELREIAPEVVRIIEEDRSTGL